MYGLLLLLLQQIHNQAIKSTSSKKLCKSYYVHSWEENKNLPKGVREAGRPSSQLESKHSPPPHNNLHSQLLGGTLPVSSFDSSSPCHHMLTRCGGKQASKQGWCGWDKSQTQHLHASTHLIQPPSYFYYLPTHNPLAFYLCNTHLHTPTYLIATYFFNLPTNHPLGHSLLLNIYMDLLTQYPPALIITCFYYLPTNNPLAITLY